MSDRDWDIEWTPYTEAESAALSDAVREFADKHGIKLEDDSEDV